MTLRKFLLPFLLVFLLGPSLACDDDATRSDSRSEDEIVGQWAWLSSYNPWTDTTTTPADVGYSETLVLGEDGVYTVLRRGQLERTGSYTVDWDADPVVVSLQFTLFELRGNDLIHDSTPVDGPRIIYRWREPL